MNFNFNGIIDVPQGGNSSPSDILLYKQSLMWKYEVNNFTSGSLISEDYPISTHWFLELQFLVMGITTVGQRETNWEHIQHPGNHFPAPQGIATQLVLWLSHQRAIPLFYLDKCFRIMENMIKPVKSISMSRLSYFVSKWLIWSWEMLCGISWRQIRHCINLQMHFGRSLTFREGKHLSRVSILKTTKSYPFYDKNSPMQLTSHQVAGWPPLGMMVLLETWCCSLLLVVIQQWLEHDWTYSGGITLNTH